MRLDVICPRWSLNLAHYTALMSWCINWPRVRRAQNRLCACMCWGCARRGGAGWKIFVTFFLRCLQRLVSVLNLDLVQDEGRIGIICSFVQVGTCMHLGMSFFQDGEYKCVNFPTVAYKTLALKLERKILKHYIFQECFQSVFLEVPNLNVFFKLFHGLKYPTV